MSSFCTPAHGVNVWTVSINPKIKTVVPAIKVYLKRRKPILEEERMKVIR